LRKLAGLEPTDAGEVTLDGHPLLALAPRERARRIAYLPQTTELYHDLRVRDLVRLGRAPHLGRFASPSDEDEAQVERALERVGVHALAERGLSTLSGGERQRVMLARMLATATPILVLDEPTTALDVGHALHFLELCRALAREGSTLVIAMHDLDRARDYADQAVCLGFEGGSASAGPVDEVLDPDRLAGLFGVRAERAERVVFRAKSRD
jgi:iron complex transport system ATP-binding protein